MTLTEVERFVLPLLRDAEKRQKIMELLNPAQRKEFAALLAEEATE